MRFSIYNIGCKVNYAEVSEIREQFVASGYVEVPFGDPAEIVLINTCTVTAKADADCRKFIRRAARNNPEAYLAVMGCHAQLKSEEIKKIDGVSGIFGGNQKFRILDLVKDFNKRDVPELFLSDRQDKEFRSACSSENTARTRVVLKIQDGCDYFCSYCAVPYARGSSRSMDFDELKRQYDKAESAGVKEIILSGINLGEYSAPTGERFIDALRHIDGRGGEIRTRISSIEPNLLTDDIIKLVKESKNICPHFHIPLQSGSDDVLKMMKRRYTAGFFAERVNKIKSLIPDCAIGIDVITGFPGETDEMFADELKFLESLDFSYLHVFSYSERKEAESSKLAGKAPDSVIKKRTASLRELSERKRVSFYKSMLGRTLRALPETYSSRLKARKAWTDNYVQVLLPGAEGSEFTEVTLKHLLGEFVTI